MATSNNAPLIVTTGVVRLSYAHLTEPYAAQEGQKKKYSASFIIDKKDKKTLDRIKAAIVEATRRGIEQKWGGKKPSNLKMPLRDGDEDRPEDKAYANSFFINANCDRPPFVYDERKHAYMDKAVIEEEVYSGSYVYASVSFYPFNSNGNKGVACGLNGVMRARDGEPLSSRISGDVAFAEIEVDDEGSEDDYAELLG